MKKRHEQSVIDGFFNHFHKISSSRGQRLIRCSMDGQDEILGGDYIFTNNARFILAEFKYQKANLSSEKKKTLRKTLCEKLDIDDMRRKQSLRCHYIAWSRKSQPLSVEFNQYYLEICNREVFGVGPWAKSHPDFSSRVSADDLIEGFLDSQYGAQYFLFKEYTNWLSRLAFRGAIEPVEILINDPDSRRLELLEFNSIPMMKNWLDQTQHRP